MFNLRLKEERQGVKLTQTELATVAGVKMRTFQDWEKGLSTPTIKQLAAMAEADVDIVYVLTGIRVSDVARKNIASMLKTTADVEPLGDGALSEKAVQAAVEIANSAAAQVGLDYPSHRRLRNDAVAAEDALHRYLPVRQDLLNKISKLDDEDLAAVESIVDAILKTKR